MNQTVFSRVEVTAFIAAAFPIGLWMVMWLSISPGSIHKVLDPDGVAAFVNGLRTLIPFAGILVASGVMLTKWRQRRPTGFGLVSPIGFVVLYGLVGLAAISQSPDSLVALRWTLLYLSVPVVLAAISWGADPMVPLLRVINLTWVLIVLATTALFAVALLKLDLFEAIVIQSSWLNCSHSEWYDLTSGRLRDTGVGRYAAISGIVAVSALWQRRWRSLWISVLVISGMLLLYSGSRGAYGGFFAGAALVMLVNGGKKTIAAAAVAIIILAPIVWVTGAQENILHNCFLRGIVSSQDKKPAVVPPEQVGQETPASTLITEQTKSETVQGSPAGTESTIPEPKNQQEPGQPQVSQDKLDADLIPATEPPGPEVAQESPSMGPVLGLIPRELFSFTGRATVWVEGWDLLKLSPLIGYGFHADRIILKDHMHNSLMQALIQTGIVGTSAFVAAILYGWVLLGNLLRNLGRLPLGHKHVVIQSGAVLAFLSMRSFPESTGAFFGVDWLILAPILFYLHVMQRSLAPPEISA